MPYTIDPFNELYHHGILGQKWGIRRYQNEDGTLTPAGKARYGTPIEREAAKDAQRHSDAKAAYGEGSGVRRKLLQKEIDLKRKNKEYAKAYEEALKNVDVNKSLKRAEKLHKKSGLFVRGRDLADRGYKDSENIMKTIGSVTMTALGVAGTEYFLKQNGVQYASEIARGVGAVTAISQVYKSARDAHAYRYYEKNKKF